MDPKGYVDVQKRLRVRIRFLALMVAGVIFVKFLVISHMLTMVLEYLPTFALVQNHPVM
jgi:hypothetical protein